MPKSQKSSKPKKPRKPNKQLFYSFKFLSQIQIRENQPISEIIEVLRSIENPEECTFSRSYYDGYSVRINRKITDQKRYNEAVERYEENMKKYEEKMKKYLEENAGNEEAKKLEKTKQEEAKKLEKTKQEEAKRFEKLDNIGKRFSLLELD